MSRPLPQRYSLGSSASSADSSQSQSVETMKSMSSQSLLSKALSSSSSLHEFKTKHDRSTRLLMAGRNPNSFPRQSEMWHYCAKASSRRELVSKGRNVWNLLDDLEEASRGDRVDAGKLQLDHGSQHSPFLEHIPDRFKIVAGVKIDLETMGRVNFGSLVAVMNYQNEILCVNHFNEVLVKHVDDVTESDHVSFKILDLTDTENLKSVGVGDFFWLQITDNVEDDVQSSNNNSNKGRLLGSKLYGPPALGGIKVNDNVTYDEYGNKRSVDGDGNRFSLKYKVDIEGTRSGPGAIESAGKGSSSGRAAGDAGWAGSGRGIGGANSKEKSLTVEQQTEATKKEQEELTKQERLAEICGSLQTIRIVNARLSEDQDGKMRVEEQSTRYKSIQAWNLGRWMAYTASRGKGTGQSQSLDSEYLQSMAPIYMQQDLCCLSSEVNLPAWPQRALGIHETTDAEKISHARYIEGLHARITEREARARLHEATDGSREGAKTPVQDTASAEKEKAETERLMVNIMRSSMNAATYLDAERRQRENERQEDEHAYSLEGAVDINSIVKETVGQGMGVIVSEALRAASPLTLESLHHTVDQRQRELYLQSLDRHAFAPPSAGCVRRVVFKPPPYPYLVEAKCVWKLCLVDSKASKDSKEGKKKAPPRDDDSLIRAKYNLGDSRSGRMGGGEPYSLRHFIPRDVRHAQRDLLEREKAEALRIKQQARYVMPSSKAAHIEETDFEGFIHAKKDSLEAVPRGQKFTMALNTAVQNHSFKLETHRLSQRRICELELRRHFNRLMSRSRDVLDEQGGGHQQDDGSTLPSTLDSFEDSSFVTQGSLDDYQSFDSPTPATSPGERRHRRSEKEAPGEVAIPEEVPGDLFGRNLMGLHSEFAAVNIKSGKELSVALNLIQQEKKVQTDAMLQEKHAAKLRTLAEEDEMIEKALSHKARVEKLARLNVGTAYNGPSSAISIPAGARKKK